MGFKNRDSINPNRKRLLIESVETDSGGNIQSIVIRGIERLDEAVSEEGTKLEAKSFLRALYELDLKGNINQIDLVEIEGPDERYCTFNLNNQVFGEVFFNLQSGGVDITATANSNDYVTTEIMRSSPDQFVVLISTRQDRDQIYHYITTSVNIEFRLKTTNELISTKIVNITIVPKSTSPLD